MWRVLARGEDEVGLGAQGGQCRPLHRSSRPVSDRWALQGVVLGLPLVVAGFVKGGYDLALWTWAQRRHAAPILEFSE